MKGLDLGLDLSPVLAAVTEYPRLGGLNNKHLFLTVTELEVQDQAAD